MRLIKHVIILAAGRGMRLMPLTKKIPKALVKLHNQSLILRGIKKNKKLCKKYSHYRWLSRQHDCRTCNKK